MIRQLGRMVAGVAIAIGTRLSPNLGAREGTHSHVSYKHFDVDGNLKGQGTYRHNITTDTASGYTNRRDWQAKALGGGVSAGGAVATMTGAATATTATSLTNSGASFPTGGQGLAGCIVAVGPNASGTGSTVFGVIVSNTGTALTVDQWYSSATMAAGTTPNATGNYQVLPGQMPACFQAVSPDVTTPATSDTTLASEFTTIGLTRALATYAHTAGAATYTLTKLFTATGSGTVNREASFAAANTTGGGAMPFESTVSSPPPLISGDTVQIVKTITI